MWAGQAPMSDRQMPAVNDRRIIKAVLADQSLSVQAAAAILCILGHADKNLTGYPSASTIMKAMRVSEHRTYRKHMKAAEASGWLDKIERPGRVTIRSFNSEKLAEIARGIAAAMAADEQVDEHELQGVNVVPLRRITGGDPLDELQGVQKNPLQQLQGVGDDPLQQLQGVDPENPLQQLQGVGDDPLQQLQGDPLQQLQGEETIEETNNYLASTQADEEVDLFDDPAHRLRVNAASFGWHDRKGKSRRLEFRLIDEMLNELSIPRCHSEFVRGWVGDMILKLLNGTDQRTGKPNNGRAGNLDNYVKTVMRRYVHRALKDHIEGRKNVQQALRASQTGTPEEYALPASYYAAADEPSVI